MLYYSCYIILQQAAGAAAAPWSVAPGTPLARGGVGGGLLAARAPAAPRTPSHTPPQSRSAGVVRLAAAKVLAVEDAGDLSELTVNELKVYTYVYIYIYIYLHIVLVIVITQLMIIIMIIIVIVILITQGAAEGARADRLRDEAQAGAAAPECGAGGNNNHNDNIDN